MEAKRRESSVDWSKVDEALASAVYPYPSDDFEAQPSPFVFPGAVLLVGRGGDVLYHKAFGCRSLVPGVTGMQEDTVFDIGSLTKVLVTTTLLMKLIDRGQVDVDRRLSRIFQTFGTHGKERMTLRHLLTHTSGYPATAPFFRQIVKADQGARSGLMTSRGAVETIYNEIFRAKLENLPGKVTKYSDIGFILLGHALEVLSGMNLDKLAPKNVFAPLGLNSTGYVDLALLKRQNLSPVAEIIAPTAQCPWRNRVLCGEVHDDNAWAMGGVAAHAGVFSNALDLHRFASTLIDCYHGRGDFLSKDVVRTFWQKDSTDPQSSWALGWDTPSRGGSSSGEYFPDSAVGHLSYTGCSMWIDPTRELDIILLSNRIHPSIENHAIRAFRPEIHDHVMEALGLI